MLHLGAKANPVWQGAVADEALELEPLEVALSWRGHIYDVATHTLEIDGQVVQRQITLHPGAVSVVCLNDDDEILLLRQYRHPVGAYLFEPPAGLMDKAGESPLAAAKRELAEEAGLAARSWDVLIDFYNSPGGSSEAHRIYLARGIERLASGRAGGDGAEENDMAEAWVGLDEAVVMAMSGAIGNPTALLGIFATHAAKARGWVDLKPADSPWQTRARLAEIGRLPR